MKKKYIYILQIKIKNLVSVQKKTCSNTNNLIYLKYEIRYMAEVGGKPLRIRFDSTCREFEKP